MGQSFQLKSVNSYLTNGAYSIHFTDAFSFMSNPACLGRQTDFYSGLITERKWMLSELNDYTLAASGILAKGGFGISFQYNGDADYNEQSLDLAYGKNLGKMQIGIGFNYSLDKAAGYPGAGFGSSDIGMCFHVSEKLITGWVLGLPVFGSVGMTNSERGPAFFRMGFGYEWDRNLFFAIQVGKLSGFPMNTICSIEYQFNGQFFFSFGINSNAGSPYFKTGWKKNRLCFQLYTLYEPVLGFSPGLVLLWNSKKSGG
ncbi:MAG TPA: hypothetical protein VK772_01005 [Puia sp.]|nr:hypothetical protein [Puia sp.]